jgi:hypothetical protein
MKKIKECRADRPIVTIRFKCGCRLQLKDKQVFLFLPKLPGPSKGDRKRLLGYIHEGSLKIFRRGQDFLRVRQCYGINVHLLQSADILGFCRIRVDTPTRGGFLFYIDNLKNRTSFKYGQAGFESQVGFTLNELMDLVNQ